MSEILTAECTNHLASAMQIAAQSAPAAVGGRLLAWLESTIGPALLAQIKAAVASGAVTPTAILGYLTTLGVTPPAWLATVLQVVLPLILSSLGV